MNCGNMCNQFSDTYPLHYHRHEELRKHIWTEVRELGSRKRTKELRISLRSFPSDEYLLQMCSCTHKEGKCSGPHIPHQGSDKLIAECSSKSLSEKLRNTSLRIYPRIKILTRCHHQTVYRRITVLHRIEQYKKRFNSFFAWYFKSCQISCAKHALTA